MAALASVTPESIIRGLRVETDALIQRVQNLDERDMEIGEAVTPYAEEVTTAVRKLKEAKHWLGECLGKLGIPLPTQYADKSDEEETEPRRFWGKTTLEKEETDWNFSQVLDSLKVNPRVPFTRRGWHSPAQVSLQMPDKHSKNTVPYLVLEPADGGRIPWVPGQSDIMANDWIIAK